MCSAAAAISSGSSSVRRKSPPVPRGMRPISVVAPAPAASTPSATSEIVPSPPSARISRRPPAASRRAISVASRGPVVKALSSSPSPSASAPRTRAQRDSDMPPPERGLTMTRGRPESNKHFLTDPRPARYPPAPMFAGILLGLGASACWAVANVAVARAGRDIGSFRALLWSLIAGAGMAAVASAAIDQHDFVLVVVAGRLDRGRGRVVAAGVRLHVLRVRARPADRSRCRSCRPGR